MNDTHNRIYVPRTLSVRRGPPLGAPVKPRVCLCHLLLFLALEDGQSADICSNYRDKDGRPVNYSAARLKLMAPDPARRSGIKSPPLAGGGGGLTPSDSRKRSLFPSAKQGGAAREAAAGGGEPRRLGRARMRSI